MMLRILGIILIPLFLASCAGGPGVIAYNCGKESYIAGDYQVAFAQFLYAANEGVTPAEYAVGYQYYYGIGTKRDEPKAIQWFQRAAGHSERAAYALHLIQEHRAPQPWTYKLTDFNKRVITHGPKACIIDVHCANS